MEPSPLLSDWLSALDKAGISPKTLVSYRRGVEYFITWNRQSYGANFAPAAIIQRDVVDWRSWQQAVQGARPTG